MGWAGTKLSNNLSTRDYSQHSSFVKITGWLNVAATAVVWCGGHIEKVGTRKTTSTSRMVGSRLSGVRAWLPRRRCGPIFFVSWGPSRMIFGIRARTFKRSRNWMIFYLIFKLNIFNNFDFFIFYFFILSRRLF